jgi:hypothetical protein
VEARIDRGSTILEEVKANGLAKVKYKLEGRYTERFTTHIPYRLLTVTI